ncbi:hypothetical protein [Jannaschia aquimarina]|uniref:Uncharacterized protein n=1 Tax=Jannaschia aquimarina TaxID=935700 RepID=A0A0D1DA56_9RHOB|nr:hypothetical protein [Jannaschia aquimarina]KIT16768.1 hypothetical protein jaqu_15560 [Jannaschia aquimarina]SNS52833.1 hypothetical protein SAMN05421775_101322 [Jannaschia aquimarina]
MPVERDEHMRATPRTSRRLAAGSLLLWAGLCLVLAAGFGVLWGPLTALNTFLVAGIILPGAIFFVSNF